MLVFTAMVMIYSCYPPWAPHHQLLIGVLLHMLLLGNQAHVTSSAGSTVLVCSPHQFLALLSHYTDSELRISAGKYRA
jgi:hypothetical protein